MLPVTGTITQDGQLALAVLGPPGHPDIPVVAALVAEFTPKITAYPSELHCALSWAVVVQCAFTFGPAWTPSPELSAWIDEQATKRMVPQALEYPMPRADLVPYAHQLTGAAMIKSGLPVLFTDEPGCIQGDAEIAINRNRKGYKLKLRDLVARLNGTGRYAGPPWDLSKPTYVQREQDGVVRLGRLVNAWASGVKTTYTVTTDTGRTVRATDEHPFLTERGWLRLDQLVPGDQVHVRGTQQGAGRVAEKPQYLMVAGLNQHPHAGGRGRSHSSHRVAEHRLIAEAALNGLPYETYLTRVRIGALAGLSFIDPTLYAVHHKDHDHINNAPENLQVLTHAEHHRLHAAEGKVNHVLCKIATERVVSVELYGEEETFDLEVADEPHNFLANGFVVHNTGKTITAILGLSELLVANLVRQEQTPEPVLVIAPASVVDPWVQALRLWAPHWRTVAYRGPRRGNLLGGFDVYVCSYDVARIDAPTGRRGPLNRLAPQALVIDECHMIKDPGTKRSQAVVRIARDAPFVIGMSGTPITHHTGNLTPMLEAMDHLAWPSGDRFKERYLLTEKEDYGVKVIGLAPHTEPEFRATLEGQMRRVAKEDVLELPPKIYSVRTVDLPAKWRTAYDEFEQDMITQLPDGDELAVMHTFTVMTHLKSMACAPADVRYETKLVEDTDEFSITFGQMIEKKSVHLDLKAPSWKINAMLEILEERTDQSVLVFAPSKQLIMLAGEAATKAGRRVGYIVGGQTPKQRTAVVDGFQSGVYDVVCVTTQAGGVGITLTAAKTLIFLQRPVSSVDATQAEDRAHRIGQVNEHVEIIDIIATNTIDTRIREILRENAGQLSELVKDPRIRAQLLGGRRADGRAA